jgi:hypothetical protein
VSETHSGEPVAPGAAEVSTDTPGPDYAPPLLSVDQQATKATDTDALYRAAWDAFYAYDGDEENATQQANILFGTTYLTNVVAARDQAAERRGAVAELRKAADEEQELIDAFIQGVESSGSPWSPWAQGFRDAMAADVAGLRERADRIEAES